MDYKVKHELLQQLLNYLVTKPYAEVFKMIEDIRAIEPLQQPPMKDVNGQKEEKTEDKVG